MNGRRASFLIAALAIVWLCGCESEGGSDGLPFQRFSGGRDVAGVPEESDAGGTLRGEETAQEECEPYATTRCESDAVYWVDSCGTPGDLAQACPAGCNAAGTGCAVAPSPPADSTDDPCLACANAHCQYEMDVLCGSRAPCVNYLQCITACEEAIDEDGCITGCQERHRAGAIDHFRLLGCVGSSCSEVCWDEPFEDVACTVCDYQSCAAEKVDCLTDDACVSLLDCAAACSTDSCVQSCVQWEPEGVEPLRDWGDCQERSCGPVCGYEEVCMPSCAGRACGPDGCGGSCGACGAGDTCTAAGRCVSSGIGSSACSDCLAGCQGLPQCCTGLGCVCQDACTPAGCPPGTTFCCGPYGDCLCLEYCPY